MRRQIGVALPMDTPHSYTKEELLALRDKLKIALGEREAVIGRGEVKTVGSVAEGAKKPHDIDLKIRIEKSLSDPTVLAAAEEAIRSVIKANCFDGPNPRILKKNNVWQWPLDVVISDGSRCLCLKGMFRKTDEIKFELARLLKQTKDFPELSPSAPEPPNSSPATT